MGMLAGGREGWGADQTKAASQNPAGGCRGNMIAGVASLSVSFNSQPWPQCNAVHEYLTVPHSVLLAQAL